MVSIIILETIVVGLLLLLYVLRVRKLEKAIKDMEGLLRDAARAAEINWKYLATGESGNLSLEEAYLQMAQHSYNLFCKKNHDYGANNLAMGWTRGISLRLGDKVARLWNLTGLTGDGRQLVQDEAVIDTFLDVANYAQVGALMADGNWPIGDIEEELGKKAQLRLLEELYYNNRKEVPNGK